GLGRAWIEGMRADSLYLFDTGIRVSQALAVLSALAAAGIIWYRLRQQKKNPQPLYVEQLKAAAQTQTEETKETDKE
ncbi:MAG: prolipoprotein diacylglyceryl transferase family protein, partial [Candidatus Onthomonas sp.]